MVGVAFASKSDLGLFRHGASSQIVLPHFVMAFPVHNYMCRQLEAFYSLVGVAEDDAIAVDKIAVLAHCLGTDDEALGTWRKLKLLAVGL